MDYELNEEFKIDNDNLADWALRKIKEEEDETNRLIAIAEDQIEELNKKIQDLTEKCNSKTGFLKSKLAEYFTTVSPKETKTQKSYKLLSGSLIYKKPSQKIIYDSDQLLAHLESTKQFDFIKTKKSVDWAEFKKDLVITDDNQIADGITGEILDKKICTVEDVPASFDIKY